MGDRISTDSWARDTDSDPKTEKRVDALFEWARAMENRVGQLQMGILSLIATVDVLVGLLVHKMEISAEAVELARVEYLAKVEEIQRAEAKAKPSVWTPPQSKIIPGR